MNFKESVNGICRGVVILVDSLYAMNQIEGTWKMGTNKDLIEAGQKLLEL